MSWDWCRLCGGEMVSCECPEVDQYDDREPEAVDEDEIDDRAVVWVVADNGVGRVEVQQ
jgi:hypothetical protein